MAYFTRNAHYSTLFFLTPLKKTSSVNDRKRMIDQPYKHFELQKVTKCHLVWYSSKSDTLSTFGKQEERAMFLAIKEMRYSKLRYGLIVGIMFLIAYVVFILSGLATGLN